MDACAGCVAAGMPPRRGYTPACRGRVRCRTRRAIDLDRAFEVRAVLNHDARGGQIADHRAILLDFDAVAGAQIALDAAVDDDFARHHVGGQLWRWRPPSACGLRAESDPSTLPSMCRSSLPEISPFTCKLAPSRAVEPGGVVAQRAHCIGAHSFILPCWTKQASLGCLDFVPEPLAQPGQPVAAFLVFLFPHIWPSSVSRQLPVAWLWTGVRDTLVCQFQIRSKSIFGRGVRESNTAAARLAVCKRQ